ncbi:MAG TPA: RiPP maturation radical SAM C-methyltransferase [Anaerolineales bacterium]|nr:RiPP maturation radical SAM C-methyltransferase [Anaerolineales bacterium]
MSAKRVMLINMPFTTRWGPAIGLSLLKAALLRDGVPCDLKYFNLKFAASIGGELDDQIVFFIFDPLLGEWLFAEDLFGGRIPPPERYFADVLDPIMEAAGFPPSHIANRKEDILRLRAKVGPFLDECVASVDWNEYAIVGFTSVFEQNVASLALARRLKERYPHLKIVFGGANCDGAMGPALHRLFHFVDYVCVGEGDLNFPLLVKDILAGAPVGDIPGIVRREDGRSVPPAQINAPVRDMDIVPFPVYDDYVAQIKDGDLMADMEPRLFLETSRGCWWGEKQHCTFCSLNGTMMQYRSKSPQRVLDEIRYLHQNYGIKNIQVVDNIMDMRYFRDMLPRLAELNLPVDLFYETKANLRKDQVLAFREAGVSMIQPGVESLSSNVLRLMRKGVSMMQNIQLLRWCAEYMVTPIWNVLAGFPGEDPQDYQQQAELVPLLTHLYPPQALYMVTIQRFAPLYVRAEESGLRNVRAAKAYQYVYPFAVEDLNELAFQFDFDFADGRDPLSYTRDLKLAMDVWIRDHGRSELTSRTAGEEMVIHDTRAVALREEYRFKGLERAVYEFCDAAHTLADIRKHLADALPTENAAGSAVEKILADFVNAKLMIAENGRYLSLAVDSTFRQQTLARFVISSMAGSPAD